jgi:hypothetical protein
MKMYAPISPYRTFVCTFLSKATADHIEIPERQVTTARVAKPILLDVLALVSALCMSKDLRSSVGLAEVAILPTQIFFSSIRF